MKAAQARSRAELKRHYDIECALAAQLRQAGKAERKDLYRSLYNQLFVSVPDHPQLTMLTNPRAAKRETARQLGIIRPFLTPSSTVLEVGAGACHLSVELAKQVQQVYAVDVSDEISGKTKLPHNCRLILSDGTSIPVDPGSIDVAYSNQLMEHLHPDDALKQLYHIYDALRPGGMYICITPNRLCGPHDVSRTFDDTPRGFHLREYDNRDLAALFRQVGFQRSRAMLSYERIVLPWTVPISPILGFERLLQAVPRSILHRAGLMLIAVKFIGIK
jgi:SAM-dependent methyltransferase